MNYLEQNCDITLSGKTFTGGGAQVNERFLVGYLGPNGVLNNWHGEPLGTYRITTTWKTPRSYVSSTMHQVYAEVDGITYTGRSAGIGMIFKGKAIANK